MKNYKNMEGTNRIAIKFINDSKIVIEKKIIEKEEIYLITGKGIKFYDDNNINYNSIFILNNLIFEEDKLVINISALTNIGIREFHYINSDGLIDVKNNYYIKEPEEPIISNTKTLIFSNIKEVITDNKMYEDMYKDEIISGDTETLMKYDIYIPKFKIISKNTKKRV